MVDDLRAHFAPYNDDLFALLHTRYWALGPVGRADHGWAVDLHRRPHGLDGAGSPGPPLEASAAWCTSMPSPPTTVGPPGRAAARSGVTERVSRRGRPRPGPRADERGRTGSASDSATVAAAGHAHRRGLDDEVGPGRRPPPTPPGPPPRPGRGGLGRGAGGPVHHHHLGRAGVGQGQDHGPGRAAGARPPGSAAPAGSKPAPRGAAPPGIPAPSVESPTSAPSRRVTQFTTPSRRATGGALVDRSDGRLLVGHGHRQPGDAEGPHPGQGVARAAGGDGKATDTQSRPEGVEGGVVQQRRQRVARRDRR